MTKHKVFLSSAFAWTLLVFVYFVVVRLPAIGGSILELPAWPLALLVAPVLLTMAPLLVRPHVRFATIAASSVLLVVLSSIGFISFAIGSWSFAFLPPALLLVAVLILDTLSLRHRM